MTEGGTRRLTVSDWVDAGFSLLADEGVKALTLERLCRRAGATKGSFYWHFADLGAYRAVLMQSWAQLQDDERSGFIGVPEESPRNRLRRMMEILLGDRQWMLERAMREWARSDATAAEAVLASDRRVLRAVRQVYLDDGFTRGEAEVRADATFALGIGVLHLSPSAPTARVSSRYQEFLDIMLRH